MRHCSQILLAGLLLLNTLNSCNKGSVTVCPNNNSTDCIIDETKTNIRIKNASNYDFCSVQMIAADGTTANYGTLRAGETTCYNAYLEAYSYAYISLSVNGEDYLFQPIDYVGETPLGVGKFCYALSVDKAYKMINITTSKD
jgi:hypothetical protein